MCRKACRASKIELRDRKNLSRQTRDIGTTHSVISYPPSTIRVTNAFRLRRFPVQLTAALLWTKALVDTVLKTIISLTRTGQSMLCYEISSPGNL